MSHHQEVPSTVITKHSLGDLGRKNGVDVSPKQNLHQRNNSFSTVSTDGLGCFSLPSSPGAPSPPRSPQVYSDSNETIKDMKVQLDKDREQWAQRHALKLNEQLASPGGLAFSEGAARVPNFLTMHQASQLQTRSISLEEKAESTRRPKKPNADISVMKSHMDIYRETAAQQRALKMVGSEEYKRVLGEDELQTVNTHNLSPFAGRLSYKSNNRVGGSGIRLSPRSRRRPLSLSGFV